MDRPTSLKRSDISLAGAVIVIAQVLSAFRSTSTVSSEISHLRSDFRKMQTKQEKMGKQLAKITVDIKTMRKDVAQSEAKLFAWRSDRGN